LFIALIGNWLIFVTCKAGGLQLFTMELDYKPFEENNLDICVVEFFGLIERRVRFYFLKLKIFRSFQLIFFYHFYMLISKIKKNILF